MKSPWRSAEKTAIGALVSDLVVRVRIVSLALGSGRSSELLCRIDIRWRLGTILTQDRDCAGKRTGTQVTKVTSSLAADPGQQIPNRPNARLPEWGDSGGY